MTRNSRGPLCKDVTPSENVSPNDPDDDGLSMQTAPRAVSTSRLRMLRLPQVCQVTGFCRSMIYLLEAQQRFPHRIKLGERAVGWLEEEVQAWLLSRVQGSRNETAGEPEPQPSATAAPPRPASAREHGHVS